MSSFGGKVALVTGAGSGIGRASALAFARGGARVIVSDVDAVGGAETVRQIETSGECKARFVKADVSDEQQVESLIADCIEAFGRLDYAHNNAGIGAPPAALHETDRSSFERVLSVNLLGVWLCLKHEARVMLEHGGGAIVNTASLAGLIGFPDECGVLGQQARRDRHHPHGRAGVRPDRHPRQRGVPRVCADADG